MFLPRPVCTTPCPSATLAPERIVILDVDTNRPDFGRFLDLPGRVYRGDRNYCAVPRASVAMGVDRGKYRDRQRVLMATDGKLCVARLVARLSPTLVDSSGRCLGTVGFFEAENRPDAVHELLAEAVDWLRSCGALTIVGPMDGDTWHGYRMNVGPFDAASFLMEPYNKPYYPELWESFGFRAVEHYFSKQLDDVARAVPRFEPILQRVLSRGYTIRRLDTGRFREELEILYGLSKRIFADSPFYEDISLADFMALYEPAKPVAGTYSIYLACSPAGREVGFLFALPDYHRAVAAMRGRRGPMARLRFLTGRRHAVAVNLKSLGVLREHRATGLGAALVCHAYKTMLRRGLRKANLCLIREGNPSGRLDAGQGRVLRRYVLYQLGDAR